MPPKNLRLGRSLVMLLSAGVLLLAVLSGGPGPLFQATPASAADQEPPGKSPVLGGPPPDLVLFYTGEVMGWVDPCG